MKCAAVTRIGLVRPGSASPGLGMATFLKPNMLGSPAIVACNICRVKPARNAQGDPKRSRLGQRRSAPLSRKPLNCQLWPRIAYQWLLLATEHEEKDAEKAEQAPARCRQDRNQDRVPEIPAGIGPNGRLKLCEAAGVDQLPQRPHAGEKEPVAGDRLGAVIDQQDKARCQADQTDEAEEESDHGRQS